MYFCLGQTKLNFDFLVNLSLKEFLTSYPIFRSEPISILTKSDECIHSHSFKLMKKMTALRGLRKFYKR